MVKGNSGLKSGVSFGVVSLTQQQQSGTAENSSSSIISESSSVDITDGAKLTKAKKLPYKTAAQKSPKGQSQKVHLYQIGKPAHSPLVITLVIFGVTHTIHIYTVVFLSLTYLAFLAAFN